MTPIPHNPSVAPQANQERWQQVAKQIRDLCESSGWEINQTQAELATAAVWDLLCPFDIYVKALRWGAWSWADGRVYPEPPCPTERALAAIMRHFGYEPWTPRDES